MRLARGAGVDGLSAMSARFHEGGVMWLRPLLTCGRAELRQYLAARGAEWIEDPSNDNDLFDRVRVRKAMSGLRTLGLTPDRLAEVAGHLAEARHALERATDAAAVQALSINGNALCIDPLDLADETPEIQRRLILRVIQHIAPSDYGPRGAALQALIGRLTEGKPAMLAGCRFLPDRKRHCIWAFREGRAVADAATPPDQWWDGHWQITGPVPPCAQLRALGPALAHCPDWRAMGVPRAALMVSPALWLDGQLIAAPHAGLGKDYSANSLFGAAALYHSVLSH
jgi:tRNA(Ile)-lysidine synthase